MKLTRHNKILIITAVSIVLLGMVVIILLINKKNKASEVNLSEYLVEVPNLPQSEWWRVIKTQEENGYQTVTNNYDGYQVTVSSAWAVQETASRADGLEMFFKEGEFDPTDPDEGEGLMFIIITYDNPEKLSITNWLRQSFDVGLFRDLKFKKTNIGEYAASKTSRQLSYEDLNSNGNIIEIPIENSLAVTYIVKGADKMYIISCTAFSDADTLIPLCEKQIQTFKILR